MPSREVWETLRLKLDANKRIIAWVFIVVVGAFVASQIQKHDDRQTVKEAKKAQVAAIASATAQIHVSQLAECKRSNAKAVAINGDTVVVQYFMRLVQSAVANKSDPASQARAKLYGQFIAKLKSVPVTNCEKAVAPPYNSKSPPASDTSTDAAVLPLTTS